MKPADSNPYTIKTRRIKGEPDMQDTLESKLELFNSFSQPVILVREGKVVYANHAAAACGFVWAASARARSGTSFPTPYSTSPTNTGMARAFRPTRS